MKNRKNYERVALTVVVLKTNDVITTSGAIDDSDTTIVLPEDIF